MKYSVLVNNDLDELECEVNSMLDEGWQCQGGIATLNDTDDFYYYQAMINEKLNE